MQHIWPDFVVLLFLGLSQSLKRTEFWQPGLVWHGCGFLNHLKSKLSCLCVAWGWLNNLKIIKSASGTNYWNSWAKGHHILSSEWCQVMLLMPLCNTDSKVCCPCVALGALLTREHLFGWFVEAGQTCCQLQAGSVSLLFLTLWVLWRIQVYFFRWLQDCWSTLMRPVCFDWFILLALMMLKLRNVETLDSQHHAHSVSESMSEIIESFEKFCLLDSFATETQRVEQEQSKKIFLSLFLV